MSLVKIDFPILELESTLNNANKMPRAANVNEAVEGVIKLKKVAAVGYTTVLVSDNLIEVIQNSNTVSHVKYTIPRQITSLLDLYSISKVDVGTYTDGLFVVTQNIIDGSAMECAIKEVGANDFSGSFNHAYEKLTSNPMLIIDGARIDLKTDQTILGKNVQLILRSEIFTNENTEETMCSVVKKFNFSKNYLELNQFVEFLKQTNVELLYLGMLPITKNAFQRVIIAPEYRERVLPTLSTIGNSVNSTYVKAYGADSSLSVNIDVKQSPEFYGRLLDLTSTRDKYYPSHAGKGASSPLLVPAGEIVESTATYNFEFSDIAQPLKDLPTVIDFRPRKLTAGYRFGILGVNFNFEVGESIQLRAGTFENNGVLINLDGVYTIDSVNVGSTTTEVIFVNEQALSQSLGWNTVSSSYESYTAGELERPQDVTPLPTSIDLPIRPRRLTSAVFSLFSAALEVSVGGSVTISMGSFIYNGITVNLDGNYTVTSVVVGSSSTEIQFDYALALEQSADWSNINSAYENYIDGSITLN